MFHYNQSACNGMLPGRPFESLGCGTTLLMDRLSYNDLIEFLPVHLHDYVFHFSNEKDIKEWVIEYQNKRATLELYGLTLMNYIHKNHSYKNRADQIINFAKENKIL